MTKRNFIDHVSGERFGLLERAIASATTSGNFSQKEKKELRELLVQAQAVNAAPSRRNGKG